MTEQLLACDSDLSWCRTAVRNWRHVGLSSRIKDASFDILMMWSLVCLPVVTSWIYPNRSIVRCTYNSSDIAARRAAVQLLSMPLLCSRLGKKVRTEIPCSCGWQRNRNRLLAHIETFLF